MARWQYQSWTEPVSLSPETTQLDKWYQPVSQPVLKVFSGAILATALFFVPIVTQAEIITLDKWFQPASQPVLKTPDINYVYPSFSIDLQQLTLPENVLLDKWYQPASQPIFPIKTISNYSEIKTNLNIVTSEIVTLDKWYQSVQQPVYRNVISPFTGDMRTEIAITSPAPVTLDKWYQLPNQPILIIINRNYLYPFYSIDPKCLITPPPPGAGIGYNFFELPKILTRHIMRMP